MMNKQGAVLLAAVFAVSGCASAAKIKSWPEEKLYYSIYASEDKKTMSREELVRRHPEWTEEVRAKVQAGKVTAGMTEAQVLAAYGKPLEILASNSDQKDEKDQKEHALWIYPNAYLVFDDGVLGREEEVVKVSVEYFLVEKSRYQFQDPLTAGEAAKEAK